MAQTMRGTVISAANDKTIAVSVDRTKRHPLYRKNYTINRTFYAHDDKNKAGIGDIVDIVEIPPVSKTKQWKLAKIIEKSKEEPTTEVK